MKRFIISALLLVCCTAAFAYYPPVDLTINSESGRYSKGDTVLVYARLIEGTDEPLAMVVNQNGKTVKTQNVELTEEKTVVWQGIHDEAVSVMVNIGPAGKPKVFTAVGYVVAPEEITPGYAAPSDLYTWWEKQIKVMRKSKPKVTRTEAASFKNSEKLLKKFECFHVEISMPEGNPVRAYVAYPKGADPKSLPIYIFAHSAGVNRKGCWSTPEKAIQGAKLGAISIDINAHGMLNDQPMEYYDDLAKGELKGYQSRKLESRESYYFRLMYLRLVRVLDYAVTLKEWDGKKVIVEGGSQGGGQSLALAGIDPRVTHAIAFVPALTDLGGALQGRKNGWPYGGKPGVVRAPEAAGILPYFDGALLINRFKGKLFVEAGLVDLTCDPLCVFAAYNNAANADKVLYYSPYRKHGSMKGQGVYTTDWEQSVYKAMVDYRKQAIKE